MIEIDAFLLAYEIYIRLGSFFGVFFVMALWELVAPRRQLIVPKLLRWTNNLALVFLNALILRLLFSAAAVGMALFAGEREWGLFNYYPVSFPVAVISSVIIMGMVIYLHHADPDFDVTTGARFHPLEIILSMLIKFAVIIILGPPVIAVIIFEVLLNATAMFNHSNIRLNLTLDKFLRLIVVTPDMHRVHHSVETDETNSNFGFNLPWWDRLFGTYRDQPRAGHENMTVGIHQLNQPGQVTWLHKMLVLPFIGKITEYTINCRYNDSE
jgi:sterol desaturase/sphingolipid hydroxylase (fatty acid hydroxylase superfamily)